MHLSCTFHLRAYTRTSTNTHRPNRHNYARVRALEPAQYLRRVSLTETQYYVKSRAIRFLDASLARPAKSKPNLLFPPRYSSNCTKRLNSSRRSKRTAPRSERDEGETKNAKPPGIHRGRKRGAPCYFSCVEVKLQGTSSPDHIFSTTDVVVVVVVAARSINHASDCPSFNSGKIEARET